MKRLAEDCFARPEDMISATEALDQIAKAATVVANVETSPLMLCENRILAEDIYADRNVPPADNAAVDGYAFVFSDYEKMPQKPREVAGRSAAGRPLATKAQPDEVVKILTGAIMPDGFDTVAMIEDITFTGEKVILPEGLRSGANRRKAGEDIRDRQLLLHRGTRLRPQEIGYLASISKASLSVFMAIRVALFSTGDELREPGEAASPGSIYDSNRYILASTLRSFGCKVTDLGILKDNREEVRSALAEAAKTHDLVITSGGVSMGDEDHVKFAVMDVGQLHFWRIAIKPGRPLAFGQIDGTAFVGLPGNPIAALVCCLKFVRPLIAGMNGGKHDPLSFQAKADFSLSKKPGRTEWLRGRYTASESAVGTVEKYHTTGSGVLSSVVWANGLIELGDEVSQIEMGDLVKFLPFSEMMR